MKKPILLLLFSIFLIKTIHAQRSYWQQQVNFVIDVKLDDTLNTLNGFEKIEYINNSPDTLHFIWFHLWPNAFRNDKTAFSDQLIGNGKTDFYFSGKEQKGYINRLDFRIDNEVLRTEDHPQHIDIIKIILPQPLLPGGTVNITTPFHVQLPHNFSRGGHVDQSFQITQWYPKPAMYDHNGWHPMPYLDQGEFYNNFGNYDVRITLPGNYVVAATGELQDTSESNWLKNERTPAMVEDLINRISLESKKNKPKGKKNEQITFGKKKSKTILIPASYEMKTLRFLQQNVVDFAWFADKRFIVQSDTLQIGGKTINAFAYYLPGSHSTWSNAVSYIKDAVRFRSTILGEYPFNVVSVVEAKMGFEGGMEYPTITSISPTKDAMALEEVIEHEVGHNWLQGILATNERRYPWLDEGLNSYYDLRYRENKYGAADEKESLKGLTPTDLIKRGLDTWTNWRLDQPVNTPSEEFSATNYGLIGYFRTAFWFQEIEAYTGREKLDEAMKEYFQYWKFKHPQPSDLRTILEQKTGKDLSKFFTAIDTTELRPVFDKKRTLKIVPFFSLGNYKKHHYVGFFPALGYNYYDKFMFGFGIHNYNLPSNPLQFALIPVYATNSKTLNGIGTINYSWYPDKKIYKIEAGISGSRFSSLLDLDSTDKKVFGGFYKFVPYIRLTSNTRTARNKETWWLDARMFWIGEKGFDYVLRVSDSTTHAKEQSYSTRYLNQLTIGVDNYRHLYPYEASFQIQQGKDFYRLNLEANSFFNYSKGGGMNLRLFAAKFGYIGAGRESNFGETYYFQPKLTAVTGSDDYTYSNYFIGRNEFTGFLSQQIMQRDGNLKLRTDLFSTPPSRSDSWVAALNLNTTLPNKLLPFKLPIKIFLDIGTYSESWEKESTTSKFLYVGGLQLSLFKDLINVFAPLVYSKEFKDNLKTVPEENTFFKKLSFSIDIQKINLRRALSQAKIL